MSDDVKKTMRLLLRVLSAIILALVLLKAAAADEVQERLRSYDYGREDAQAGIVGGGAPGALNQSAYDTGYREQEQRDGNKPEINLPTEDENQ
jgi:hypothetical protein